MEGQVFACYPFLDAIGPLTPNLKFRAHQLLSGFQNSASHMGISHLCGLKWAVGKAFGFCLDLEKRQHNVALWLNIRYESSRRMESARDNEGRLWSLSV